MNVNSTPTSKKAPTGAALKAQQDKIANERVKARAAKVELVTNVITFVAMVGIGVIAFTASYQELRELCVTAGKSVAHWYSTANLIPISIDLMLIVASIRLRRKGLTRIARLIARVSSLAGLLLSLGGNVIHGWWTNVDPSISANYLMLLTLVVSAVPVASLLASTEMLTHTHKDTPVTKARKASPAKATAPKRSTSKNAASVTVTA